MKPNFEPKIDTAEQLVENDITVFMFPGAYNMKELFLTSPILSYNKLGEKMYITQDWDECDYYTQQKIINEGTHATVASFMYPYELEMGNYYKSKDTVIGDQGIAGYMSNKKWNLTEVCIYSAVFSTKKKLENSCYCKSSS